VNSPKTVMASAAPFQRGIGENMPTCVTCWNLTPEEIAERQQERGA
jgi:hypothetical protein